jgi:hypothetical protein
MSPAILNPIPEIYILWHPDCILGEFLARQVYAWLRPGNGLGPQVYYRCLRAPEAPAGGLPPPLPGEFRNRSAEQTSTRVSNLQILLLLIDDNMIANLAWRQWLSQLTAPNSPPPPREIIPIALDSTAFNAPEGIRAKNFLRPTGLSANPFDDNARKAVVRSLLKQLTEALCWLMLRKPSSSVAPALNAVSQDLIAPKLKIFLSHAKADGATPARRIRDYIYSQTQLAAFYDENDIPFGSAFKRVLEQELGAEGTAALIVVRSAKYARRPWCRWELSAFRRPIPEPGELESGDRWRVSPVIVVEAIEDGGRTEGIPELGNAPLIRWADSIPEQEEQIVTSLLRDAMLASFHSALGRTLQIEPGTIVLNWLPDANTLLRIPRVRENAPLKICYPGQGLSGLELDILFELFPNIEFHSFEEMLS